MAELRRLLLWAAVIGLVVVVVRTVAPDVKRYIEISRM
ncbi:DUF6893 family small protein [Saccharopolyspora phatthalungensis]|uniref:Uncharacterized protein n=1 Tax=Saccharopolyspora phatthalungensis TaxID=664693 RepID=A0A840PXT2_9PSEU|nr:hypothetical protein [Saccharopolyspora phatthalungensis]